MTSGPLTENGFRKLATAAAAASLFAFAVVVAITPASIVQIGAFYHASNSLLGVMYFVQAAGFMLTVVGAGWLSDRRGKLPVMLAGSILMGIGACMFWRTTSLGVAFLAIFLMGAGGGFSEGVAMAVVADLHSDGRRTAMLNYVQFAFAVGAVSSPLLVGKLLGLGINWKVGYLVAAAVCVLSGLANTAALAAGRERPISAHHDVTNWKGLFSDPLLISLAIGIMLYVGAESGQGNWLAVYFKKNLGSAAPLAASTVAIFWGGLGVGRLAATHVSKRASDLVIICTCLALTSVTQAALLVMTSPFYALAVVFMLGFSCAPVWPTILSRASAAYPRQSGTVFGILVAAGSVGFAVFPPVIGRLGDAFGSIRPALWVCFAASTANLGIFLRLWRSGGGKHGHG